MEERENSKENKAVPENDFLKNPQKLKEKISSYQNQNFIQELRVS